MKITPKTLKVLELFGWYGTAAILLAYALISFNVISPRGWVYQSLNFSGAIGVMAISFIKQARQPALLNLIWAIVALIALISIVAR